MLLVWIAATGLFSVAVSAEPAGMVAQGSPAATPFYINASKVKGPTVLIVAGVHGDEPAGPCAAEEILSWPIHKGKLIVLPRANVLALAAHSRPTPGEPTHSANLNRDFPPKADATGNTPRLAAAIWQLIQTQKPDWVIDLHEGSGFRSETMTDTGRSVLGNRAGQFDCFYYQGPIVGRAEVESLPDYEVLAYFRTEVAKNNTPKGIMVNSPAAFSGRFGRGRVLCFSPHPEQSKGLEDFVPWAVYWVSTRQDNPDAGQ